MLKSKMEIMGLNIDNQTEVKADFLPLAAIYERAIMAKILPEDYALELCLCGAEFIRQHNKVFRGLDQKTDVLSFEMSSSSGSLLICLEYLLSRSGKDGLAEDLQAVFAHGICHLGGCDHLTKEQTAQMKAKENAILQAAQK